MSDNKTEIISFHFEGSPYRLQGTIGDDEGGTILTPFFYVTANRELAARLLSAIRKEPNPRKAYATIKGLRRSLTFVETLKCRGVVLLVFKMHTPFSSIAKKGEPITSPELKAGKAYKMKAPGTSGETKVHIYQILPNPTEPERWDSVLVIGRYWLKRGYWKWFVLEYWELAIMNRWYWSKEGHNTDYKHPKEIK